MRGSGVSAGPTGAYLRAFTSIINIIIVMSTVGNVASAFYTSRILYASERASDATVQRMLTTAKQRCFMLSESRLSRQQGRNNAGETATAKRIRICARLDEETCSSRAEKFFFSHRVLGHLWK